MLVFYLPSASGEKVALSISISGRSVVSVSANMSFVFLVSLVFFLLLVSKILPPSKSLPLMAKCVGTSFTVHSMPSFNDKMRKTIWSIRVNCCRPSHGDFCYLAKNLRRLQIFPKSQLVALSR